MRSFAGGSSNQKRKQDKTLEIDELTLEELINRFSDGLVRQEFDINELVRPLDQTLINSIKPIVSSYSLDKLDSIVQQRLKNDRTFSDFVTNYLNYIKSVKFIKDQNSQSSIDHDLNFDLLLSVYNPAANIFRRADAAFFTQPIQLLSHALVHFAITADRQKRTTKNEKTSEAARQMTTTLGVACIDRSTEEPNKRRAAFSLANGLFKIYFFLNNMRLCDTVVKNTSNVMNQLETHYPKSELVTFHYYLGRLALYQRRLHKARDSLKRAFDLCRTDSWKNRRLILIYLIAASLPLGILPLPVLLERFSLVDQFTQLVANLRTGNWPGVRAALDHQVEWFRFKGIYLLLREKLEVICWRNFFVILAGMRNGNQGVRLSLTNSVEPARKVFMEPSIDEDDIVCMASSLIDQGYLKAYVKFGEVIVFGTVLPRISTVGEHMNDSGAVKVAHTAPNMSTQNSNDSMAGGNHQLPGIISIRGARKFKPSTRFA